jgi:N-acetylmuramoyl-L-alanine amidase
MEEKIVRPLSLLVAIFALFICSSLYYLPGVEAKAQQYLARQLQARKERQQREEMWAMLSGLEFLDYSTRQALAATTGSDQEEDQDLTALDFTQQLRLELPKNISADDVEIENHYVTKTIDITIPGAGEDYLISYPMIGKSDHIENLQYLSGDDGGTLELSMEHVYELSLDWEGQYLYIDFVSPQDIYDKIVVIDAGHGDDMPGATVDHVEEKDIDLAIVQELKELFDEAGDETLGVYYTRLDDTNPEFADRSGLANDLEANLFVSVHNNSYTASEDVNGTAVLYDEKKDAEGNSSKHLANILLEQTCAALDSKNMGLVQGNDIYIIRTSDAPAALVEVGFMTNPTELKRLTSEKYQKACAQGIYDGILQALEEGY